MSDWGRVDEHGTVYVRTAVGERAVGSWQAGLPEEGLAHFERRFEQLATEVSLLEQRLAAGAGDPRQVLASARRLAETLPGAAAVGDLDGLARRVDSLGTRAAAAVESAQEVRDQAREQSRQAKQELVAEAEALAVSSDWRAAGERLRGIGEDWKRLAPLARKADDELWQGVAAARQRFAERRSAHFAALDTQRSVSSERKQKLVDAAESLQGSTDWKATADRFKALMADWKTAGRAGREQEEALWVRFKAAQDAFFSARNAAFAGQDEQYAANQKVKEAILAEAESLDAAADPAGARRRLRELQSRWEAAGRVPREALRSLDARMAAVEDRIRAVPSGGPGRPAESPFAARLREKVAELEDKLARARAAGRPTGELEAALATQREWLRQAGSPAPEVSPAATPPAPAPVPAPARSRNTSAWVRAADS